MGRVGSVGAGAERVYKYVSPLQKLVGLRVVASRVRLAR